MSLPFFHIRPRARTTSLGLVFLLGCGVQTQDLRTPPSRSNPQTHNDEHGGADAQKGKKPAAEEKNETNETPADRDESAPGNENSQTPGKSKDEQDGQQLSLQWSGTSFEGTDKLAIIATE